MTSPANKNALSFVLDTSRPTHDTAPTQFVEVDGTRFAHRRFSFPLGTPIVLLQHFRTRRGRIAQQLTRASRRATGFPRPHPAPP